MKPKAFRFAPETMVLDPPHLKKVVYLDQFVISEIVNSIDPQSKAHTRVDPFWRQAFEALQRVSKLQLVVCPWSPIHRDESLLSGRFERLQRMYEHLANGVRFVRPSDVEQRQLSPALGAWLDGKEPPAHDPAPERITSGGLHRWHGRLLVSVSMNHPPEEVDSLRQRRTRLHGSLSKWFEGCRQRSDKTFEHALKIEQDGHRDVLLEMYRERETRQTELLRQIEAATGEPYPFDLESPVSLVGGPGNDLLYVIVEVLKRRGIAKGKIGERLGAFLDSEHFRDMPINRTSTRMFALIAHDAANGQKTPPDEGTANDIDLVSAYLPYCDAMMIDKRTRLMLERGTYAQNYHCQLFSRNTGEQFLNYLKTIETEADPFIPALVRNTYGEDWLRPYVTMFET
jgi:hypothetical protein